jgi:hypothetical protein
MENKDQDEAISQNRVEKNDVPDLRTKITFDEHREQTAKDCEEVTKILMDIAIATREGNMQPFESFWYMDMTDKEHLPIIFSLRHILLFRYFFRQDIIER